MLVVEHNAIELSPRISEADVADYIALLKPRVMSLVIFTALVGLLIAPVHVHPVLAFTSILCIAVGAGALGALNQSWSSLFAQPITEVAVPGIGLALLWHFQLSCLRICRRQCGHR